jgi:hypothetical protein
MPDRNDFITEVLTQLTDYFDTNMPDFRVPLKITLNHWKYPTELVIIFTEQTNEVLGKDGSMVKVEDGV